MLSREQQREYRTEFWGKLTKIMDSHRSKTGRKVNWLNYPLGLKEVFVRMEFDENGARFCIDLQQRNLGVRELFFEQFQEFSKMLESALKQTLHWEEKHILADSEFQSSRIYTEKTKLSFVHKQDWPAAWEFLQSQLLAFDEFWAETNDVFIGLEK